MLPDPLTSLPEARAEGSTLRRQLGFIARSRYLIIACVCGALLLAAVYNFGSRPLYESVSVISLDEAGISPLSARHGADQTRKAAALDEQFRLLKSPEMALVAVGSIDPVVAAELSQGPLGSWLERIQDEVRYRIGRPRAHGSALPDRVAAFRSRLSVEYQPPSSWVYVRFRAFDREAAAKAVNGLITAYLAETARQTEGAVGALRKQIDEKVAERKQETSEVLGRLDAFEKAEGLERADTRRDLLGKEQTQLQASLIQARQDRVAKQALMEELKRLGPADVMTLPAIRDDRDTQESLLRASEIEGRLARDASTLGERHPQIVALRAELESTRARINARVAALKKSIALEYRLALRQEQDVVSAMSVAQRQQTDLDKSAAEHSFIQKEADAGQKAVGELIEKSVQQSDDEVFFAPKVLQTAEPAGEASSPRRARNFQYAALIGLCVGVFLAWLSAHLDETVKTPDDLRSAVGLPLLGMVPRIRGDSFDLFQGETPNLSRVFEAYRVLRTNLLQGHRAPAAHSIVLMTSSREGEGKTTTTCGLGITLARAGFRILMVDGDLRRASLSRLLSAEAAPGLVDAVIGQQGIRECVRSTSVPGLKLLPAGRRLSNPAEMLNHESMATVLGSVRGDYDWILCDAPPVLAVADAAILCRLADTVLLIVGANKTPVGSVQAALEQLAAVKANVGGVVLNNVDLARDSHYYKYYYSSHYGDYSHRGRAAAASS